MNVYQSLYQLVTDIQIQIMEAHSKEKTRSGDGVGKRILEMKSSVLGTSPIGFRRQKSEKFPFCRSYSPFLSCDGGAELLICRSKITYLSAVVSLFVGGNLLICRRSMMGRFECQIVIGSYIIYYND